MRLIINSRIGRRGLTWLLILIIWLQVDMANPTPMKPTRFGRHPRIGFLDGAIDPQRETKASVFTPWDESSYVVIDVPEAIWSNLGLTYLAHTHIPTVWDDQERTLEKQEWHPHEDGSLSCERTLPNGIVFGTKLSPGLEAIQMEMWLTNGTDETLTDLRVQNCVMLKGATGFDRQTNDNMSLARLTAGVRWTALS